MNTTQVLAQPSTMPSMSVISINGHEIIIKEYRGKRVLTFKDIDALHQRTDGTARKRFNENRVHFIEGTDFYKIKCSEVRPFFGQTLPNGFNPNADITLITESGYLMLVKSFHDDLAWEVQRKLVNGYFRIQTVQEQFADLSPELRLLINLEISQKQQAKELAEVKQEMQDIRDAVALHPDQWREETRRLISKIAQARGGGGAYQEVNEEIYSLVNVRGGVNLRTRLANKYNRMAGEGARKSQLDKLNKLDVIAEDKKLREIYIAIVKEMAVKFGVSVAT